jgi:tryptophanyl-tRNA synthetase
MSKSDADQNSRIELTDLPEVIEKKLRKAVTDLNSVVSYDREKRPGVSTLIDIESACTDRDPEEIIQDPLLKSMDTGLYKKHVASILVKHLEPIQAKYLELINDKAKLRRLLDDGAHKANQIAEKNYKEICKIVGFQ